MTASTLHDFDVRLCRYGMWNIQANLKGGKFASLMSELPDPLRKHLQGEETSQAGTMLLGNSEFAEILSVLVGPPELDRRWEVDPSVHEDVIFTLAEVRSKLSPTAAWEWSERSGELLKKLWDEPWLY